MDHEMEDARKTRRPKKTWSEVVEKDCQIQQLCK